MYLDSLQLALSRTCVGCFVGDIYVGALATLDRETRDVIRRLQLCRRGCRSREHRRRKEAAASTVTSSACCAAEIPTILGNRRFVNNNNNVNQLFSRRRDEHTSVLKAAQRSPLMYLSDQSVLLLLVTGRASLATLYIVARHRRCICSTPLRCPSRTRSTSSAPTYEATTSTWRSLPRPTSSPNIQTASF